MELKAASSRPWRSFAVPSDKSISGMSISLPNFFKYKTFPNGTTKFVPKNKRNYGVLIFVTRLGDGNDFVIKNRYETLIKQSSEENRITSKSLSEDSYTIWSDLHGKLDSDGKDQELFMYAKGLIISNGVYEIYVRFQREYRDAITAILPRIVDSFKASN
ncbi:MAG: hypothetical protein ACHQNE_03770 [Candidatus Kapaibacterium sp.]